MLKKTRFAALLLSGSLALLLPMGCSSDDECQGKALHPDLEQEGDESPISALETWISGPDTFANPPAEDWIVVDSGEKNPAEVVIKNEAGDGWWVSVARTDQGGWVVSAATDNATDCEGELDGLA